MLSVQLIESTAIVLSILAPVASVTVSLPFPLASGVSLLECDAIFTDSPAVTDDRWSYRDGIRVDNPLHIRHDRCGFHGGADLFNAVRERSYTQGLC